MVSENIIFKKHTAKAVTWRRYSIEGNHIELTQLLRHLPLFFSELDQFKNHTLSISEDLCINIEVLFSEKDEIRFLKHCRSVSDTFFINSTYDIFNCPPHNIKFDIEVDQKIKMEVSKLNSRVYLKPILAIIISNYISINNLNRSNILSLALYLHFSIFYVFEKIQVSNDISKGELLNSYINEIMNLSFNPEIDYKKNRRCLTKITKEIFFKDNKTIQWLIPFSISLKNQFATLSRGNSISYNSFIIESKVKELINETLGLSRRERLVLYYFISREIMNL